MSLGQARPLAPSWGSLPPGHGTTRGDSGCRWEQTDENTRFPKYFFKKYSYVHFERDGEVDEVEVDVVKPKVAQGLPGKLK